MSTSLLYHAWGVRGYCHRRTEFEQGRIIFHIEQDRRRLHCPVCGSHNSIGRGRVVRRWRSLPIGGRPVMIQLGVGRVGCRECGAVRQTRVDFADPRCSYTRAFERYALELSRRMTIQDVARHLGISWDVIKQMQKRDLRRRFGRPRLSHLRRIAIDEIAVRKGHRYLTVVLDLTSGRVVFVGQGKAGEALEPFWRRLRRAGAQIEAVAMDLSPAYISAVESQLPTARIVFDHFHVVKLMNQALSDLRKSVQRVAVGLQKQVIKGLRWVLLKNPEHLDEEHRERERLEEALRLNAPLAAGYYLKEDLRQLWDQPDKSTAHRLLQDWIGRAVATGARPLRKFARTLGRHAAGILAWYDFPISSGPLEGINNKIKTMKRQAYGFRDMEFFKLKILGIHETEYALIG